MKIYNSDFYLFKDKIKNKSIDFVIVDIPYNLGDKAFASRKQWWKNGNVKEGKSEFAKAKLFETDEGFSIDKLLEFMSLKLKENKNCIIFCSYEQQFEIINKMKKYGFKKYIPLVFIKKNSSEVLKANMRICGACEYGLQLFNGNLGYYNNDGKMIKNYFEMERIPKEIKKHPTQKPLELIKNFITLFTKEGETVMDMCLGQGTTAIACKELRRNFIGFEIDEKYYKICLENIKEVD